MSMNHYFLGQLEDNRSELAELTRDKINEMIDAVALDHNTTRDAYELFPLISKHMIPRDEIKKDIMEALKEKNAKIIDKHNFGYISWPKALFDIDSTDQDAVAELVADWDITLCDIGTCTDICDASAFAMQRAWFPNAIIQVAEKATAASFNNNKYQAAALDIARCMLCDVV